MAMQAAKVMFEIYREAGYAQKYRAVYFTELDEHNKEAEIARAMAGQHLYDSFLAERKLDAGKVAVAQIVARLNDGEDVGPDEISRLLEPYEA